MPVPGGFTLIAYEPSGGDEGTGMIAHAVSDTAEYEVR
jgi:hypothetical protein